MVGYPHETESDINQTVKFINENKNIFYVVNVARFVLTYGSEIYYDPEAHGITILSSTALYFTFAFDESCGLKWEQKKKQQENSKGRIIKAIRTLGYLPNNFYLFFIILFNSIIVMIRRSYDSIYKKI